MIRKYPAPVDSRPTSKDLAVATLGKPRLWTPMKKWAETHGGAFHFIEDSRRLVFDVDHDSPAARRGPPALMEAAGPRRKIFFDPKRTRAGIVTCGGLCPGINDVIRSLVMTLHFRYGVEKILGFRYGYQGLTPGGQPPMILTPDRVKNIHHQGGTILASSRGPQDSSVMVDTLLRLNVSILFVIGGDGTLRGALALSREARRRKAKISVVGIPKTIDNDIRHIDRSFGFETAFSKAMTCVESAHTEALGAPNGVGLVKVMGRDSGHIACHAALANPDVNFVLIPENPFRLDGPRGFIAAVKNRLQRRHHAVIIAAEGAGQDLFPKTSTADASGNRGLGDIGLLLKKTLTERLTTASFPVNVKYIDPSYIVRSVPASPDDSLLCLRLGQAAVHAAMAGKTELVVAERHNRFVHLPMPLIASGRRHVDVQGPLWQSVLEETGQPPVFF